MSARILHRWCDEWELQEFVSLSPRSASGNRRSVLPSVRKPRGFEFGKSSTQEVQAKEVHSEAFDE
jgi:hypothetical protein